MASQNSAKTQQLSSGKDYSIDEIIEILSELSSVISEAMITENVNGSNELNENRSTSCTAEQINTLGQGSNENSENSGLDRTKSTPVSRNSDDSDSHLIPKIGSNLHHMRLDFGKLKDFQNRIGKDLKRLDRLKDIVSGVRNNGNSGVHDWIKKELDEISKITFKLMCQVPMLPFKLFSTKPDGSDAQNEDSIREGDGKEYLPGLHWDEEFIKKPSFEETREKFKKLKIDWKLCLLTFAVFPENCVVKKRMLMYWWIGEGFIPVASSEKAVDEILEGFSERGLIEPVEERRRLKPTSFKLPPLVHSAIVALAKHLGFFEIYSDKGKPIMKKSNRKKVCLAEGSSWQQEAKVLNMKPGDIETVFNISERFPDFTFKWFSEMKSVRVLYLGRWERTAERHIEVESTELMKDLGYMKKLRFLSFQGISRIEKISGSVCKLPKLTILDLRACHNLEKLPEHIDSLENLIYLDISECYMLDRMPKKMSLLSKLEVLKGFVVSDADEEMTCTLAELKDLPKLRKLSININRKTFTLANLIHALMEFKEIRSLKVAWGGVPDQKEKGSGAEAAVADTNQTSEVKNQTGDETKSRDKPQEKRDEFLDKNVVSSAKSEKETQKKKDRGEKVGLSQPLETSKEEKQREERGKETDVEDKIQEKKDEIFNKNGESSAKSEDEKEKVGESEPSETSKEEKQGEELVNVTSENKSSSEIVEENSSKPLSGNATETKADDALEKTVAAKPEVTDKAKGDKGSVAFAKNPKEDSTVSGNAMETKADVCLEKTVTAKPEVTGKAKGDKRSVAFAKNPKRDSTVCSSLVQKCGFGTQMLGRKLTRIMSGKDSNDKSPELPPTLEKLDLQCFPEAELPSWLTPEKLLHLRKLYIKGGTELTGFGEISDTKTQCTVEVLRLKFLPELTVEWRDLREKLFPNLMFLEKYQCPKVTFCPCDGIGVWSSEKTQDQESAK